MRPIIIAIVGASGSGKTTLSKYLQRKYGIPAIVSTTTRPRREGEVEGEDYFFVRSTRGIGREAMLTYTRFGKHEYFSLRRQLPENDKMIFCDSLLSQFLLKFNQLRISLFPMELTKSP